MSENRFVDKPENPALELGQRLKRVRELNGLSQRELARRAGVTNSNVSMIEQGSVSPSINSLARLLDAIPMSLSQFFAGAPEVSDDRVYPAQTLPVQQCSSSGIRCETLPAGRQTSHLSLSRYCFSAGCDTGPDYRVEHCVLAGWILEGELELSLGAKVYSLSQGDSFCLPVGQLYRLRNTSTVDAWAIVARQGSAPVSAEVEPGLV